MLFSICNPICDVSCVCFRYRNIRNSVYAKLDKYPLLVTMKHLYMVEIYHIGTVATNNARAVEMLCNSCQCIAYHSLLCLVAIDVVDADIVVCRLNQYEVLSANRKAHLALLVENLDVSLLQYGFVLFDLLRYSPSLPSLPTPTSHFQSCCVTPMSTPLLSCLSHIH